MRPAAAARTTLAVLLLIAAVPASHTRGLQKGFPQRALLQSLCTTCGNVWINEIHYANPGINTNERVEVAYGPSVNLAELSIVLYNGPTAGGGSGGGGGNGAGGGGGSGNAFAPYSRVLLSTGTTGPVSPSGFSFVTLSYPNDTIRNGLAGLALVQGSNTALEFLSYGGTFTAVMGPAKGTLSIDIGVVENASGSGTANGSLQRTGCGNNLANFPTWVVSPSSNTFGAVNTGQGTSASSPLVGKYVTVRGTVTAAFQGTGQAGNYFIQDVAGDNDPATSDAINIASRTPAVRPGDTVQVTGVVSEFNGLTRITPSSVVVCSSGNPLPTAIVIPSLPSQANQALLEQFEGMLVTLAAETTIQDNFVLGRFGKVIVGEGGRQFAGTQIAEPGPAALAAESDQRTIVIGDAISTQDIVPAPFGLSPQRPIRVGDTFAPGSISGVLTFETYRPSSGPAWTILPAGTELPAPIASNPRPVSPPNVGGTLQVVTASAYHYFSGPPFPTLGGASSQQELVRQRTKLIAALAALNADVYGLLDVANDGYGPASSIAALLTALNTAVPGADFRALYPGQDIVGGNDESVRVVYKAGTVKPLGVTILNTTVDPDFRDDLNLPSLIASFVELRTGGKFTVAVTHLKDKGSDCNAVGDPNKGDGQGECNLTRTKAAIALMKYLATDPTGSSDPDFIVLGNLNAYLMEDPVDVIRTGVPGTVVADLVDVDATASWTYVENGRSGTLDHILYTPSLASQHAGSGTDGIWHINADEPVATDYRTAFNQPGLYAPGPFRSSDHDPVAVGLAQTANFANLVSDVLIGDVLALNLPSQDSSDLLDILNKALAAAKQVDACKRRILSSRSGADTLFLQITFFLDSVDKDLRLNVLTQAQAESLTTRFPVSRCQDNTYPGTQCPADFFCRRSNEYYWQCIPGNQPDDLPPPIVQPPPGVSVLPRYAQCGGEGGDCTQYGQEFCADRSYPGFACPAMFACTRQNQYYWQCIRTSLSSTSSSSSGPACNQPNS
ncbi:hypothetical protein WJX72_012305 [[Myrmecia] bisecta]|uniref:ExeM/NucH family extracellular endonuclease n=1 Tax=[Myrmecia] bisecta TaxID=41462 RepID=A0AAW1P7A9_9CHLO